VKAMKKVSVFVVLAMLLLSSGCRSISRILNSGGTVFVVDVAPIGDAKDIVEKAVRITQTRLDAAGIDGEVNRLEPDTPRIEVRIFGQHDLERVRTFLFKTYKLELKKVLSPASPNPVQVFPDRERAQAAAVNGQQVLPYAEYGEYGPTRFVVLEDGPIVTGEQLRNAQAYSRTGSDLDYVITFTLNAEGAGKFGDWTAKNINNYLAVVLNDEVQSVAYIKSQITDTGEISGRFTKAQAEEIAASLNSGHLPAELKVVEERPF
jgi:preprotein translocase subunit SecD